MQQNAEAVSTLAQREQQNVKPNAVEAVRAAGRFAEAEAEGLKRLLPPLQAPYESLSDQQKPRGRPGVWSRARTTARQAPLKRPTTGRAALKGA